MSGLRLQMLYEWAVSLEAEKLVRLATYHGVLDRMTLLPRLKGDDVGLVTIWNDSGGASLQFWRTVFERRAPNTLPKIEDLLAPMAVGQGNTTRDLDDDLLALLTEAYREAAANQ